MIKQLKLVTKDGNNLEMKNCPYSLGMEMIACSMSDEAIRAAIKSLEHKLMCRAKGSAEAPEPQEYDRHTTPAKRYQPMLNAPKDGYFLAWDNRNDIWVVVNAKTYWGWQNVEGRLGKIYKEEIDALSCWTDLPAVPEPQGK